MVHIQPLCLQPRDMTKNLMTKCFYFIWYSIFLMHLKNAWSYLGLTVITVVVVVFDYAGDSYHGMGVRSGIGRVLNIES